MTYHNYTPTCTSETLGAALLETALKKNLGVEFYQPNSWHSYDQLAQEALLVAGALQQRGISKGQRIAIVLPTHPDFYRAFFGALFAGAIPAALYPPVRLGKIQEWKVRTAEMLQLLNAKVVLTDTRLYNLLGFPVRQANPAFGCLTVQSLLKEKHKGTPLETAKEDLAVVQFSSGSTGKPKPVALTHENILSNARAILSSFPNVKAHSGVSWLPLYHDMGLVGCLISAIVAPGNMTLIRPEQFIGRPKVWLEALSKTKATISVAPNFAYSYCMQRIKDKDLVGLDLSNWKIALCGAESVHPSTLINFAKRFAKVGLSQNALTPVYGLAEATLAVTFAPLQAPPLWTNFDKQELKKGHVIAEDEGMLLPSLGSPLAGTQIEIRDGESNILGENKVGKVWVKGSGVMAGYLDQPEQTGMVLKDGWLDTGDKGFLYKKELYLYGREKDIIIIHGKNYDPAQIEQSLIEISGLREGCAAAFGVADTESGTEKLVVLAEYRSLEEEEKKTIQKEIAQTVQTAFALSVSCVQLLPAGTLPRTSSGKIRRQQAKQQWLNQELLPPGQAGLKTVIYETIAGIKDHLLAKYN